MHKTLHETKAQRWRALAVFKDGSEGLLYLGHSYAQVTEHYDEPYFEYYDQEERDRIAEIHLQKWVGAPDRGKWVTQKNIDFPKMPASPVRVKTPFGNVSAATSATLATAAV
jgi:hypothetical protein